MIDEHEPGAGSPEQPRHVTVRDRRRIHVNGPGQPGTTGPSESGRETGSEAGPEAGQPAQPGTGPGGTTPSAGGAGSAGPGGQPGGGPASQEEELSAAKAEAAGYLEDLQRLKAEFDNYRKRIAKDQAGLAERASAGLVHRLLPVLDNLDLALAAAEENRDFERMLRGIEMVFGQLREVLGQEGLERIAAKGKAFDPNYHEAALEVEGGDGEPYVADELRSGYLFKGRVLRPSMVKVARGTKSDN